MQINVCDSCYDGKLETLSIHGLVKVTCDICGTPNSADNFQMISREKLVQKIMYNFIYKKPPFSVLGGNVNTYLGRGDEGQDEKHAACLALFAEGEILKLNSGDGWVCWGPLDSTIGVAYAKGFSVSVGTVKDADAMERLDTSYYKVVGNANTKGGDSD